MFGRYAGRRNISLTRIKMFELLFDILFTIIFLVPFGISLFYFVMAFRLLLTAVTEHSEVKRKGAY